MGKSTIGFLDGDWILSRDMSDNGKIGVVQLKHIGKGKFLHKDFKFISEKTCKKLKCTRLEEGDLLVSRMAEPICRSCILPKLNFDTVTAVDVTIIKPDPTLAKVKYLNYFLNTEALQNQAKKFSVGTTRERISKKNLQKLKVPLPSISTQEKIVSMLDNVEQLRERRKQADKLTEEYLQNVFIKMFGEPKKNPYNFDFAKLKTAFSKNRSGLKCGPFGSALKKFEYVKSGIPVWTMDNIHNGAFLERKCLFVTEQKFNALKSYAIENGDVIISRAGTVGKMCVVETSAKESIISSNLIRLSLDKTILSPVYFVCLMEYFKGKIGRLKTGADGAYTFMNTKVLETLEIPIPPINLQKKFVEIYRQIKELRQMQLDTNLEIVKLSSILTEKAFNGD